jgi:hypothetical protein
MEGAVLSRRHAAAVVELSRQDLRLEADPRQGRHPHLDLRKLHLSLAARRHPRLPVIGGNSLSVSYIGTFLVFVYVWMPYMILPTQAALERVPGNLIEASSDLGATPLPDVSATCSSRWRFPASSPARSSPSR